MKAEIHPEYKEARIVCACGNVIETRSTVDEIHVEICSSCHPFFTGKQKLVDTAGRVEKFRAKYGLPQDSDEEEAEAAGEAPVAEAQSPATVEASEPGAAEDEAVEDEAAQAREKAEALQRAREELAAESGEPEEPEDVEETEEVESEA